MDRPLYLNKLIRKQNNGMIKVITGIRRCGKTYLLFNLFYNYLINNGVRENHIIRIQLDNLENKHLLDSKKLYDYLKSSIKDNDKYYILLDEVQMVKNFESALNSCLHINNIDAYVTGSNAKFLSKDVITEFRGRGDQVHLYPLSFSEFMTQYNGDKRDGWQEYITYGGLPKLVTTKNVSDKAHYLTNIFIETYIKDIIERNNIRNESELDDLINVLASSIGSLTNPKKLSDTFKSVKNTTIHPSTIKNYLDYLEDAFLVSKAQRYDVKGKKYIGTPLKYYFSDVGLRNALLNFRQLEETHLMENVIYNELLYRGYSVDVGIVEQREPDSNKHMLSKKLEIDFVCNLMSRRLYIQCALTLPNEDKIKQETKSLLKINDTFKKIIIVKDSVTHYNDDGILILNLFDFLLNEDNFDF